MKICEECGAKTELDGYFFKAKGEGRKKRLLCPTCAEYHRHERGRRVYKDLFFGLLFGLLFLLSNNNAPWLFLNIYLLFAMMYLSIVPHELGHAFAVWLMRQELLYIRFGRGHRWFTRKVRGVHLDFQTQPLGGLVGFTHRYPGPKRFTDAFIYACGPLVNIGIFFLVWGGFPDIIHQESFGKTFSPWISFANANLLMGVFNLIPYRIQMRRGVIPNDGMGILKSLFGKNDLAKTELEQNLQRALVAYEYQDYQLCRDYSRRVMELDDTDVRGRIMLAASLDNLGEVDCAINLIEQTLDIPNLDAKLKPALQSGLSYFYLVKGDPGNYEKALELADAAMLNFSWDLSVLSNYGGIQVVAGDIEKGIKALNDKRYVISPPYVQAEIHALLAIGRSGKGEVNLADKELNIARKLDPECKFLERATVAVSEAKRQSMA